MVIFEDCFIKSQGKPINYRGQTLIQVDYMPVSDGDTFNLFFEEKNSDWDQAVCIDVEGGALIIENERISGKDGVNLWENKAPKKIKIEVDLKNKKKGKLIVYNAWDWGDGVTQAWHNGAAMYVEHISNGRRYYCNDGDPDDDLNDLIFRIERVQEDL